MSLSRKQKGITVISLLTIVGISIGVYNYIEFLKKYEVGIQEPIKNGLPFEIVNFNAEEGLILHKSNGTHIEIPANSIVDANGNEVSGAVEFRFREMHKAQEIFLSGIPMQMSDDRSKHLQSMGMVEMRVFEGNNELMLKKGKKIEGAPKLMYALLALILLPGGSLMIYFCLSSFYKMSQSNWDFSRTVYGVSGEAGHTILILMLLIGSISMAVTAIKHVIAIIKNKKIKD